MDDELERLAARVVMGAFAGPRLPHWVRRRLENGLGGICLFGSNITDDADQLTELTRTLHDAGAGVLVATDEEGGDVTRLHMRRGSPWPGNAALGAADDEGLTERVAASIGRALRAAGVDLDLGPVTDVNSNPHNPVIGVRSFGADPDVASRHTRAYVRGLQAQGVGACVKHWPGHGDTAVDSHLGLPTVDVGIDVLRRREFAPFAAAVQEGVAAMMTSHVVVTAVDARWPATLSPALLGLLRDELRFHGLLISDALDMAGARGTRGEPAAAVLALAAGCDLLCLGPHKDAALTDAVTGAIAAAVRDGALPFERLAEAAQRVVSTSEEIARRRAAVADDSYGSDTASEQAAARALTVRGRLPPLRSAVVLRPVTGTNIAVGDVPWGLPDEAPLLRDGGRQRDVRESDTASEVLADAAGQPLVVLVREPHRRPWVAQLVADLAAAREDLVVVEMGWPGPEPLPGGAVVHSWGASRVSGAAVADLLARGAAG